MSRYDEDLFDNPFFVALKQEALFEKATANRWIICVPKFLSVEEKEITKNDFEDHILIPTNESKSTYTTVSKHVVTFGDGCISLGTGFKEKKQVHILFEETFYNSNDECYSVLCVSSFFNRQFKEVTEAGTTCDNNSCIQPPVTYQDCLTTLWGHQGSSKTKENLDKALIGFCADYQKSEGGNISNLADLVSSQVTAAMQIVLKDYHMKRLIKINEKFMQGLKIAVEMYMMNAVHKHLFATITSCVKSNDAQINKMTRNLLDISLQQLEVKMEFQENLPFARNELSKLNHYSTPLGKLLCIKRVAMALMRPVYNVPGNDSLVMTSNDLLPLMIYLIIKSQIPNWTANLLYMKCFLLSKMTDSDEYSFYLSTTEAALDFINSGNLKSSKSGYTRQTSGETKSIKEKFFQYVQFGDEAAVLLMLKKPDSCQDDTLSQMCHPLCTCDKCVDIEAKHNQNSGPISPISRDDMGRTALHIAAFYGQAHLIDILVKHGKCQTDATDYLGCTPLHLATQKGFQNIILLLVHYGADVSASDNEGNKPLHLCAKNGHDDCVKALLFLDTARNKLDVNAQNDMGDTPLHLAAKWGYNNIVSFLLESKADPRVRNFKRQIPINIAQNPSIKHDLQTVMNELPPVTSKDSVISNKTASKLSTTLAKLPPAASSTHQPPYVSPVQPLPSNSTQAWTATKMHPGTNCLNNVGYTDKVVMNDHGDKITNDKDIRPSIPLIDNSSSQMMSTNTPIVASLDKFDFKRVDKLFKAIANQDLPLVKFYLGWVDLPDSCNDDSTHVSSVSSSVSSPSAIPSKQCHPLCQCEDCRHLHKHSNNILHMDCQNKLGFMPLHISVIENNLDVFMLLLQQGASVNVQTNKCTTPLHWACFHNRQQMVHSLIEYGADVNLQDQHGEIPLQLSAAKGNPQLVQYLIKYSSNIDWGNVDGNSALHLAVMANSIDTVHVLLENGASPEILNKDNKTPYSLTKNVEIQEMLRKKVEEVKVRYMKIEIPRSQSVQDHVKYQADQGNDRPVDNDNTLEIQQHNKMTKRLSYGIRIFDKQKSLKKSKTFDNSAPLLDDKHLKLSLSIKKFDKERSLKHIDTMDKSKTFLKHLTLSMSIHSFNAGSLKHVVPSENSTPLHIYCLSQSFSSYAKYDNTMPTIELQPTFEDAPPTVQDAPPTTEGVPPTIEEAPPTIEDAPPTCEDAHPTIEDAPPTCEDAHPTNEDAPPTGEDAPPAVGDVPLTIGYVPPTCEDASPTVEDAPLTTEDAPPTCEDTSPTVGDVPSTVGDVPPAIGDIPPTIEDAPSTCEDVSPTVEDAPLTIEDASPTCEDTLPTVGDVPLTVGDVPPTIADVSPTDEDAPPTCEDAPPITEFAPPTCEDAPPTVGDAPPTIGDVPPTVEDAPPTCEDAPPTIEDAPPTCENTPSTIEDKPPTINDKPLTIQDTPPTIKNTPLVIEDTPYTSKNTPPTNEDKLLTSEDTLFTSKDTLLTSKDTPLTSKDTPLTSKDAPLTCKDTTHQ